MTLKYILHLHYTTKELYYDERYTIFQSVHWIIILILEFLHQMKGIDKGWKTRLLDKDMVIIPNKGF